MRKEDHNVKYWAIPVNKELDVYFPNRYVFEHSEKVFKDHYRLIDEFFLQSQMQHHYKAYMRVLGTSEQKRFKGYCLRTVCKLLILYRFSPQCYGHNPDKMISKAMIQWKIRLIRKYRGMEKYTSILDDVDLPTFSKKKFRLMTMKPSLMNRFIKLHKDILFDLSEVFYLRIVSRGDVI